MADEAAPQKGIPDLGFLIMLIIAFVLVALFANTNPHIADNGQERTNDAPSEMRAADSEYRNYVFIEDVYVHQGRTYVTIGSTLDSKPVTLGEWRIQGTDVENAFVIPRISPVLDTGKEIVVFIGDSLGGEARTVNLFDEGGDLVDSYDY